MSSRQQHVVGIGTIFDASGHKARVTGITNAGVVCVLVETGREVTISRADVEHAVEAMRAAADGWVA